MNACVHGMGWHGEPCGRPAKTRREGWPLCANHAEVWDAYEVARVSAGVDSMDFVAFAKGYVHA